MAPAQFHQKANGFLPSVEVIVIALSTASKLKDALNGHAEDVGCMNSTDTLSNVRNEHDVHDADNLVSDIPER